MFGTAAERARKAISCALIPALLIPLFCLGALADGEGSGSSEQIDPAEARKQLAEKAKKKLRTLTRNHKAIAKWCAPRGLMRHACRHYFEVLEIDPDERTARRFLGFKKKGKEWVSAKAVPKLDKVKGAQRTKLEEALFGSMAKYNKANARALYDLAKEAEALGLKEETAMYMSRVLGYEPGHEKARAALGYKKRKGKWVKTAQADWIHADFKIKLVEEKTNYEEELGISLNKANSKRVWVAGYFKGSEVKDICTHANAAINSFHNLFELKSFIKKVKKGRQLKQVYVRDEATFAKFVDAFSKGDSRRKKFIKGLSFANIKAERLMLNRFKKDDRGRQRDRAVYLAGNKLAHGVCGNSAPPWIAEGVAWGLTLRMLGTKFNYSVALQDSSAGYGAKNWSDHSKWKDYLREMVLIGDSPHPSSVLMTRDWNSINNEKAAYAWSMVDFLWETMPDKFYAYCKIIGEDKKAPVDKACRDAFGFGMTELDAAWRQYVKKHY